MSTILQTGIFLLFFLIFWIYYLYLNLQIEKVPCIYSWTIPTTSEIQKKLEESEIYFQKYAKKRDADILKHSSHFSFNIGKLFNYVSAWDLFQPYYSCPHYMEVCGLDHLAQKPSPCIVYSYGVSSEYSFEKEILSRTNCSVFMYDHTINPRVVQPLLDQYKGRVQFKPFGIRGRWSSLKHTLKEEMDSNGHQFIDIIKMDVEGNEFQVFEQILQDYPHELPFGQLQIELHILFGVDFKTFVEFWQNIEKVGLRAFHYEPNNSGYIMQLGYQGAAEYSFINVKVDNYLINPNVLNKTIDN